ncbi:hypothetical protein TREES_T100007596 [Tupaia chinensis]|uniref:Uncharacterized protein n=1 Tax=Tupaia chinensis TaxID=246437 RepID=L9KWM0_TUPCH|nr:hypothetical protein TREES_T100007596 [Tupaia chinensis]
MRWHERKMLLPPSDPSTATLTELQSVGQRTGAESHSGSTAFSVDDNVLVSSRPSGRPPCRSALMLSVFLHTHFFPTPLHGSSLLPGPLSQMGQDSGPHTQHSEVLGPPAWPGPPHLLAAYTAGQASVSIVGGNTGGQKTGGREPPAATQPWPQLPLLSKPSPLLLASTLPPDSAQSPVAGLGLTPNGRSIWGRRLAAGRLAELPCRGSICLPVSETAMNARVALVSVGAMHWAEQDQVGSPHPQQPHCLQGLPWVTLMWREWASIREGRG